MVNSGLHSCVVLLAFIIYKTVVYSYNSEVDRRMIINSRYKRKTLRCKHRLIFSFSERSILMVGAINETAR
jgi:hypothetical protein